MFKGLSYYKYFLNLGVEKQNELLVKRNQSFWQNVGFQKAIAVFHEAAERVPAYKDFLRKNDIRPERVKNQSDFANIPTINKKNYLSRYSLDKLCWDGDLTKMNVISASSGTSGSPFFWPREFWQEQEVDHYYELVYNNLFNIRKSPSLLAISFALGMYIAGPFTFASSLRIAQKGYPLSITTPSGDIDTTINVIRNLHKYFNQVIIGGYPPLVRDIISKGQEKGISWGQISTRLFFGGECFTEEWRKYLQKLIGAKNALTSLINMYGTADAGLLAIESPFSIAFRMMVNDNTKLFQLLFRDSPLPSILTYNPLLKYFEVTDDGHLLFTSYSGIPLLRYQIGDKGGIIDHDFIIKQIPNNDIRELTNILKENRVQQNNWNLPLVYLFGRDNFTAILYGANIYPENIKKALDSKQLQRLVSGKFIMRITHTSRLKPRLQISIELSPRTLPTVSLKKTIQNIITDYLLTLNSEYAYIFKAIGKAAMPVIQLNNFGDQNFKIAIKHRWRI